MALEDDGLAEIERQIGSECCWLPLDGSNDVAVADDYDVAVWVGHLKPAMGRFVDDVGHGDLFRLPLVMDEVDVVHHQVPTDRSGGNLLGVGPDHQVGSAPHLKGGEMFHHGDAAHSDPFVEACRCRDVGRVNDDMASPDEGSIVRCFGHGGHANAADIRVIPDGHTDCAWQGQETVSIAGPAFGACSATPTTKSGRQPAHLIGDGRGNSVGSPVLRGAIELPSS